MGFPVLPLVCIEWRTIVFVGFLLGSVLFLENHIAAPSETKKGTQDVRGDLFGSISN